ncbi:uncharacterized protein LOC131021574 isoform X3 [Salvia miltiorrhiza]|nr:uncharacterized protein LOC131021574 isoform X3 [Salvia miltiorrhiza]XP_057806814.1 uncharacterized protein LOC131021574 isoform X3 [Salvia miltiorrhiza]
MDKGWMSKNRLSNEYEVGVESFLQFAVKNGKNPNVMPCPCVKCGNLREKDVKTIRAHLTYNGMDLTYVSWIYHGERSRPNTSNKEEEESSVGHDFYSDEPVDMVHDAYVDNPTHFHRLLEEAEMPLYFGCDGFTKLSATVKLYNLKAKYGWSDTSFTDLLMLIGEMLPKDNVLPSSLYEAKKSLSTLGMKYEKIHACPEDCILYRNEYANLVNCPTCGKSRWKVLKNDKINEGVPAKVLWYFPPIPRFQRMFGNKEMSSNLRWHADKRVRDGHLRHPADSPAWKLVDEQWPNFGNEPRNLRLALSADGINPHSVMSSKYSCWPIILITYNLPPWLCMKRKHMMLTLLVSGPHQPGNDIDVYLAPLIDDLKQLWEVGAEIYDAYHKENFMLRAVLLWTINDFPAYGNLSGSKVKGYFACPVCADQTYAKNLKHSRKMSYTGHRRFLPDHHPYRRQKKTFNGKNELGPTPNILSGSEVFERVENINCVWGKKSKKSQSKGADDKSAWKKKSIFFELEYWKHLHIRHCLDVMHIEKNVCESLFGTLLNIPGKTKDGVKARLDLADMGLRNELAPMIGEKRTYLPPAFYTLSKAEKRQVCAFFGGVKVPTGYSSNVASLLSADDSKLVGLKSHDCHTLMQQLLPVAIRGVLTKQVRYDITRLCFFFNVLCNKVVDVSKLEDIQGDITTTLCLLEKHFPPSFFDIMVHLTIHLVREVKLCGPVWYRWMYQLQSYIGVLARQKIKVNIEKWSDVPQEVKGTIWESVKLVFNVHEDWKKKCLTSANTKWRQFKSYLYKTYIIPFHDQPELLYHPPPEYIIPQDDWKDFVITRMSEESRKKSQELTATRKQNVYPHHVSRKGYAGLREEMKEQLTGDYEFDRALLWKQARANKKGEFEGEMLTETVSKIDVYLRQKHDGVFTSSGPSDDVLTQAIGKPEQRGRVRGVGAYVTPTTYYKKSESEKGNEVQEMKKQMAEMNAKILELQQQMMMNKESEEKGSCSVKNERCVEVDDDDVEEVPRDNVLSLVKTPRTKSKKDVKDTMKLKATDVPTALKMLHKYASVALNGGRTIQFTLDPNVFGNNREVFVEFDEIHKMCELEPIAASSICVYIWHLYKECEASNILDRIRFVDPYLVSCDPSVDQNEQAGRLGQRLIGTKNNQLVMMPCNVGWHWILLVIDPHKETVYALDPLLDGTHVEDWKSMMTLAMKMFNMSIGTRGRKTPLWETINAPQQPDGAQCGFYVMRFMRDVFDNLVSDHSLPLATLFTGGCYSKKEIDEMRIEWAEFLSSIDD